MKLLVSDSGNAFRVIPDSAIGRTGQPWFLPDSGSGWRARFALAVRISRLGKCISPAFYSRYVDAATLLWLPEAEGFDDACFMDGAAVCGRWVEGSPMAAQLCDAVCRASVNATLKNGDIVALCLDEPPLPILRDSRIERSLGQEPVIAFNVK